MTESTHMENVLIEQLLDSLRELPDVHAELAQSEFTEQATGRVDAKIDLHIAGRSIVVLVEAKKSVYPRDVRQALWQLKSLQHHHADVQHLLIAELLSPGAKELLRAERIGYFDSGGSLFLPASGAYIYIDKPAPKTLEKSVRSFFSGRRAQVLYALLVNHEEWFGVTEVAERAQVAPSTASDVLSELERFDWLVSRGQGPSKERHLREPSALLDAWAKQLVTQRAPVLRRYFVPGLKSDALIERLAQMFDAHQVAYAVSYEAAAQRYAPFLSGISQVRVRLLPSTSAEMAMAELGARVVNEGANLAVIETKSAGELLFRQNVGSVWLASPVQVYLDLLRGEGRAKELAEHLRKERIGF
ncbi:type IV toxin-antitoxin system AbiEi family antitoxin [Cupriavidus basilensis]|uniref:type IV toxin-antitoxin system AbiEi family antitoxin n=1 Tax=Cupriavidus basilensis TaxID=68895 RepID=UPI0020A6CBE8|nr:type IV toxin-antitoxin system AbiEi family antitoxin [Cupriavidus basilensis]MCP3018641.1 type IV toxin-antitoxin system AbiEi family antitoxin [Cupriavidus basilensis]